MKKKFMIFSLALTFCLVGNSSNHLQTPAIKSSIDQCNRLGLSLSTDPFDEPPCGCGIGFTGHTPPQCPRPKPTL